jgi:hypothetical protein
MTTTRSPVRPPYPAIGFPTIEAAAVPVVTAAQMREVDRLMVEVMGIDLLQMMENAGRSLAEVAVGRFRAASVTVLAGRGNNGGGGLAAARHLADRGVDVSVVLPGASPPPPAPPGGSCGPCGRWAWSRPMASRSRPPSRGNRTW